MTHDPPPLRSPAPVRSPDPSSSYPGAAGGPRVPRAIARLIAEGVLDAPLAALLWLLVEGRVPLLVAAPAGTGSTTLLGALLELLPRGANVRELAGYAEDFGWLPEAGTLGWRPHGFRGIATQPSLAEPAPAEPVPVGREPRAVSPASTVLVVSEFGERLPAHTWGEGARIAIRALSLGYGMGATIHAESLEEVLDRLGGRDVDLTMDELSWLGVVLILRFVPDPRTGQPVRRVVAAHYLRPVARDAGGHVRRLGPAVLATWEPAADRFEDFAWGVVPELAVRVGRRAGDLEAERDRRAAHLAALADSAVDDTADSAVDDAADSAADDAADSAADDAAAGRAAAGIAEERTLS